jgi:hypothetical protein
MHDHVPVRMDKKRENNEPISDSIRAIRGTWDFWIIVFVRMRVARLKTQLNLDASRIVCIHPVNGSDHVSINTMV